MTLSVWPRPCKVKTIVDFWISLFCYALSYRMEIINFYFGPQIGKPTFNKAVFLKKNNGDKQIWNINHIDTLEARKHVRSRATIVLFFFDPHSLYNSYFLIPFFWFFLWTLPWCSVLLVYIIFVTSSLYKIQTQ